MLRRLVHGDWGSISVGTWVVALRTIVVATATLVWLATIVVATGQASLDAAVAALAFLVPVVVVATLTRSITLWRVGTFVLWGGAMIAVALIWVQLYSAIGPDHGGGRLRTLIQPAVEEILKLAPLLAFLWLRRRDRTWSIGATDVVLMGAATGAAFGFVEDSYIRAQSGWAGNLPGLPVTELVSVGTRLIAGHAIWTTIAASTIGLALLIRSRGPVAIVIALIGPIWSFLDHAANNSIGYLGRLADSDLLVAPMRVLTDKGFATVGLMLVLGALVVAADLIVLRRVGQVRAAEPATTPDSAWRRAERAWTMRRTGRAIGYLRWQLRQFARRKSWPRSLQSLHNRLTGLRPPVTSAPAAK